MKIIKRNDELFEYCLEKEILIIPCEETRGIKFIKGEDDYRFATGKYEDEEIKPRLAMVDLGGRDVCLAIGRVMFRHILEDRNAYYDADGVKIVESLKRGINGRNPLTYLASSLGVTALVETSDSQFALGSRRDPAMHSSSKLLHGIAGYCEFGEDVYYKIDPYKDMTREIREEAGIRRECIIRMTLLGLCFHQMKIGANFIFYVKVGIDSSYFKQGGSWENAIDSGEHRMFEIFTKEELFSVLTRDDVHYSTRGAINQWLYSGNKLEGVPTI